MSKLLLRPLTLLGLADAVRSGDSFLRQVFFQPEQEPAWARYSPCREAAAEMPVGSLEAPHTGMVLHGCNDDLLDLIMACKNLQPEVAWTLREIMGSSDLRVACLEDLLDPKTSFLVKAKHVHPGSVMLLEEGDYLQGLELSRPWTRNISLVYVGSSMRNWTQEQRHWRVVLRDWDQKVLEKEPLIYFPMSRWLHFTKASSRPIHVLLPAELREMPGLKGMGAVVQKKREELPRSALCLAPDVIEAMEAGCIPVMVRNLHQDEPMMQLQAQAQLPEPPFLFVQKPEDLPQVLKLKGFELDALQEQCQAWWKEVTSRFRQRVDDALRSPRQVPAARSALMALSSGGCLVLFLAAGAGVMLWGCTPRREGSRPKLLSVEVTRFGLTMLLLMSHFWEGWPAQSEDSLVWLLLALGGMMMRSSSRERYVSQRLEKFWYYQLACLCGTFAAWRINASYFLGLQTWMVPWQPLCMRPHLDMNACPAYRVNAPLWPFPGVFLCWAVYPLLNMLMEQLHSRNPTTISSILLLLSALCYGLGIFLLDLPFASWPPLLLLPFSFGVFSSEWLLTLVVVGSPWWQMALPIGLLLHQLVPGLPSAWPLPLLLPLMTFSKKGSERSVRPVFWQLGKASYICYLLQLPVAQLMLFLWEAFDGPGIAYPSASAASMETFPQMRTLTFLSYLGVLWSLSLLLLRRK